MLRITSRQNAAVKRFRDARDGAGDTILLDGPHLIAEALSAGLTLETVAVLEEHGSPELTRLADEAARRGAQLLFVAPAVLDAMSPVRQPSGIVAVAQRPVHTLDAMVQITAPLVLLLDRVQDPGNVGTIVRVAEACGATGVVTGPGGADPFGWKALRGSMGSAFRLPVLVRQPLAATSASLTGLGLRLLATVPRDGTPLAECNLRRAAAVMLGGEGSGLSPDLLGFADEHVTIPMTPAVESLNVAVAAALIVYEAQRQRARWAS